MLRRKLFVGLLLGLLSVSMVGATALAASTVTIWGWRSQDRPVWEAVQEKLRQAGHDIVIQYEAFLPTEYDSKMALALQSGQGPDIVYTRRLPGQRTQDLIDNRLIVPLDGKVDFRYFTDATLGYIRSGGKTWGVPFANQIIGIFYNKRIYDKYGLKEPKTWDELVRNAQVLKQNGVTPFFVPGRAAWALAMQHAMAGVSVLGPDWIRRLQEGKVNFLDPAWIDLNRRLNDLKPYYQKDFLANSTEDQDAAFAFEEAAMVFYGIWGVKTWRELNPALEVGYFPVPPKSASDKAYAYVYMDGSFALTAMAKNVEAALTVLRFAASPDFGTLLARINGEMPAVTGANVPADNPILREALETATKSAAPWTYWVGSPLVTGTPSLYDILAAGMQEMYAGKLTPEEFARRAQEGVSSWYGPLKR